MPRQQQPDRTKQITQVEASHAAVESEVRRLFLEEAAEGVHL